MLLSLLKILHCGSGDETVYCLTCLTLVTNVNHAFLKFVNILLQKTIIIAKYMICNGEAHLLIGFFNNVWDNFSVTKNVILVETRTEAIVI